MKKLFLIPVAAALFAACSNETENTDNDGPVPLQISVGNLEVSTEVATRAANSAWEASDQIGVYALPTGTTTTPIAYGSNKYYTLTDETGSTDATGGTVYKNFTGTDPVYLPANGSAIDVYGYYPYSESATDPTAVGINVSTQTDATAIAAIDFMTTGKEDHTTHGGSETIKKNTPSCQLLFAHRLVKLVFNLKAGTGMSSSDITSASPCSVSITGQKTEGTYNIYTDALTYTGSQTTIVSTATQEAKGGFDKAIQLIVLPTHDTNNPKSDRTVTITLGTATYQFTIFDGVNAAAPADPDGTLQVAAFEAGKEYTFDVTVNAARLSVTAAITNWVSVAAQNATAK